MTEQMQVEQQQEQTGYDLLRNNTDVVSAEIKEQWLRADFAASRVTSEYQKLIEDSELRDDAKIARAQHLFQTRAREVAAKRKGVRDALLKAADSAERASVPFISGHGVSPSDANALIASQYEADRIRRTLERRKENSPFVGVDTGDYLKSEYERGLEIGGVEGAAILRGCLRTAEEMGAGDTWLPRQDRHNEYIERARLRRVAADLVSVQPPKPTKSLRRGGGGPKRLRSERGNVKLLLPGNDGKQMSKRSNKHW